MGEAFINSQHGLGMHHLKYLNWHLSSSIMNNFFLLFINPISPGLFGGLITRGRVQSTPPLDNF